jgi:hypothetical protein
MHALMISIVLFGLLSCSKEMEYSFQVKNRTNYRLDKVSFDWCNQDNKITINTNSSTDIFTLAYKTSGANIFATGSLCITVLSYSDTISTYENTIGISIERNKLNKKNPNVIIISEKTSPSNSNIFSIELE